MRRLDARIDRISALSLDEGHAGQQARYISTASDLTAPRIEELVRIVKALSSGSASKTTPSPYQIRSLLLQSGLTDNDGQDFQQLAAKTPYETELEWLLIGKATVQTYGLLLETLLDRIIPLSDDIWYWDDVLGSYWNSTVYTAQTSPVRMWRWSRDIYSESVDRFRRLRSQAVAAVTEHIGPHDELVSEGQDGSMEAVSLRKDSFSRQWRQFYLIVRESIAERTITDLRRRVFSHVGMGRAEARSKQSRLRKLREMTATGLGILMLEGLDFGVDDGNSEEWKGVVERSVALMDMILQKTHTIDYTLAEFEDKVFAGVEEDPELSIHVDDSLEDGKPSVLARRILDILDVKLPGHANTMTRLMGLNGRPTRLVRYWLPAAVLLISSSTILRMLVNRQEDIVNWLRDFGATTRDFWFNWVVEPTRKIIGTIRHDETSEIAIMSRDSLKADQESLERMVVDFALDKPDVAVGASTITDAQVDWIRSRVKEGDVTSVLKAYERDMRRPFVGAVKGDLVRSLLIQVQKTKVDLEVAISGIDALLKSQELVFGFLGLTPGILGKLCRVISCPAWFLTLGSVYRAVPVPESCFLGPQGHSPGQEDSPQHPRAAEDRQDSVRGNSLAEQCDLV